MEDDHKNHDEETVNDNPRTIGESTGDNVIAMPFGIQHTDNSRYHEKECNTQPETLASGEAHSKDRRLHRVKVEAIETTPATSSQWQHARNGLARLLCAWWDSRPDHQTTETTDPPRQAA